MKSSLQVPGRHSISVVSPVYNGEASIAELCRRLNEVLPRIAKEYEIILVNDGSRDGSWQTISELSSRFAAVRNMIIAGDQPGALRAWRALAELPRLLFAEPSPAPIKHWLWRTGLIESAELRLPMTEVSAELAARLDREIERRTTAWKNASLVNAR